MRQRSADVKCPTNDNMGDSVEINTVQVALQHVALSPLLGNVSGGSAMVMTSRE